MSTKPKRSRTQRQAPPSVNTPTDSKDSTVSTQKGRKTPKKTKRRTGISPPGDTSTDSPASSRRSNKIIGINDSNNNSGNISDKNTENQKNGVVEDILTGMFRDTSKRDTTGRDTSNRDIVNGETINRVDAIQQPYYQPSNYSNPSYVISSNNGQPLQPVILQPINPIQTTASVDEPFSDIVPHSSNAQHQLSSSPQHVQHIYSNTSLQKQHLPHNLSSSTNLPRHTIPDNNNFNHLSNNTQLNSTKMPAIRESTNCYEMPQGQGMSRTVTYPQPNGTRSSFVQNQLNDGVRNGSIQHGGIQGVQNGPDRNTGLTYDNRAHSGQSQILSPVNYDQPQHNYLNPSPHIQPEQYTNFENSELISLARQSAPQNNLASQNQILTSPNLLSQARSKSLSRVNPPMSPLHQLNDSHGSVLPGSLGDQSSSLSHLPMKQPPPKPWNHGQLPPRPSHNSQPNNTIACKYKRQKCEKNCCAEFMDNIIKDILERLMERGFLKPLDYTISFSDQVESRQEMHKPLNDGNAGLNSSDETLTPQCNHPAKIDDSRSETKSGQNRYHNYPMSHNFDPDQPPPPPQARTTANSNDHIDTIIVKHELVEVVGSGKVLRPTITMTVKTMLEISRNPLTCEAQVIENGKEVVWNMKHEIIDILKQQQYNNLEELVKLQLSPYEKVNHISVPPNLKIDYIRPILTDTTSGNVPENHFSFKILEELQQLSKFLQTSSIIEKRLHELRNLTVTDHDQSGKLNWEEIDKQAYAICDSALTDLDNSWAKRQSSEQSQSQPQYNPNKITQSGGYGTNCWAVFNYYKIIPKHLTGPGKRVKLTDTSIMKDRLQVLWASKSLLKLLGDPYKNPFHTRGRSLENHLRDNGLRRLSEYCKKFDTDYPDPSATSIELLKEVGFQNVCQTSTATICKMSKKFKHTDMKIRQGKSGGCCDDNTSQYNLFFMCINPNNPDPFHKLFDREPNRSISRTESIVSYTSFCNDFANSPNGTSSTRLQQVAQQATHAQFNVYCRWKAPGSEDKSHMERIGLNPGDLPRKFPNNWKNIVSRSIQEYYMNVRPSQNHSEGHLKVCDYQFADYYRTMKIQLQKSFETFRERENFEECLGQFINYNEQTGKRMVTQNIRFQFHPKIDRNVNLDILLRVSLSFVRWHPSLLKADFKGDKSRHPQPGEFVLKCLFHVFQEARPGAIKESGCNINEGISRYTQCRTCQGCLAKIQAFQAETSIKYGHEFNQNGQIPSQNSQTQNETIARVQQEDGTWVQESIFDAQEIPYQPPQYNREWENQDRAEAARPRLDSKSKFEQLKETLKKQCSSDAEFKQKLHVLEESARYNIKRNPTVIQPGNPIRPQNSYHCTPTQSSSDSKLDPNFPRFQGTSPSQQNHQYLQPPQSSSSYKVPTLGNRPASGKSPRKSLKSPKPDGTKEKRSNSMSSNKSVDATRKVLPQSPIEPKKTRSLSTESGQLQTTSGTANNSVTQPSEINNGNSGSMKNLTSLRTVNVSNLEPIIEISTQIEDANRGRAQVDHMNQNNTNQDRKNTDHTNDENIDCDQVLEYLDQRAPANSKNSFGEFDQFN